MKKQQENSTHKNNSALFCESIYDQISSVSELVES